MVSGGQQAIYNTTRSHLILSLQQATSARGEYHKDAFCPSLDHTVFYGLGTGLSCPEDPRRPIFKIVASLIA